jgi:hypothetical protein
VFSDAVSSGVLFSRCFGRAYRKQKKAPGAACRGSSEEAPIYPTATPGRRPILLSEQPAVRPFPDSGTARYFAMRFGYAATRQAAMAALCQELAVRVIPSPIDQNSCAHWRNPMDMMRQG